MIETGFWKGAAAGLAIAAGVMFLDDLVVSEQRDAAVLELEHTSIRLDEARRDCRRPTTKLSCDEVGPSSGLFMCRLPGDRFTWLTWKAAGEL